MWQAFKDDLNDIVRSATHDDDDDDDDEDQRDEVAPAVDGEESFDSAPSSKLDESLEVEDGHHSAAVTAKGDGSGILDSSADVANDGESRSSSSSTDDENENTDENGGMLFDMLFRKEDGDEQDEEMTPEDEAARRCELEKTFTEPLVAEQADASDAGDNSSAGSNKAKINRSIAKEHSDNGNYNPSNDESSLEEEESIDEDVIEQKEIQQFLDTFDVQAHTQEISQLLSTNNEDNNETTPTTATPTTPLQMHFQTLVPETVSYTDFWTRYYYRCDPHRIAMQWERQEHIDHLRRVQQQEIRERALKEVSDAALSIGRSAASFLKGGLSGAITGVGGAVEEAATSLRVHQSKGRPLFVMDVMEDDDDSYYEEEEVESGEYEEGQAVLGDEDDEDEGLGWSSDDEEEEADDEEDDIGDEDEDEEVNFLEVSLDEEGGQARTTPRQHTPLKLESIDVVKLRQSLIFAEGQRNNLMQMVDERNEEICKLRSALEQQWQSPPSSSDSNRGQVQYLKREADWLKHLVAATTSHDSDRRDTSVISLKLIIEQMRNDLHCQNNTKLGASPSGISKSTKAYEATIQDLQSKIQARKDHINSLQSEADQTDESIVQCQVQLHKLEEQRRNQAEEQAKELEQAVAQARASLVESTYPASTPNSSMSSGVKVSSDGWDEDT